MIGRLHHVVIDCPRPDELAEFYAELIGRLRRRPARQRAHH